MENTIFLPKVVTIDGGSATGKSSTAIAVARKIGGFNVLNSGMLYRCIGYLRNKYNIPISDIEKIVQIAEQLPIHFSGEKIFVEKEDCTTVLHSDQSGIFAAEVSALLPIRESIYRLQLSFRKEPGLVAEGRDMGELFEDTPFKYFLKTAPWKKARRRYQQFVEKDPLADYDEVLQKIIERDYMDTTRPIKPLKPHPHALQIDNTHIDSPDEVAEIIAEDYFLRLN